MIPYDHDPSLYSAQPEAPLLDDGFSPPHHDETDEARAHAGGHDADQAAADDLSLGPKSLF